MIPKKIALGLAPWVITGFGKDRAQTDFSSRSD